MRILHAVVIAAVTGLGLPLCLASPGSEPIKPLPESPAVMWGVGGYKGQIEPLRTGVEPFSSIAVQIKVGVAGPGIDIATPVAKKLNLRVGVSFLDYSPSFTVDGEIINGTIEFRTVNEAFDFFPFGNGFRVSPGITFYNGNHLAASASVPAGQTFTLNAVNYISSPQSPITGSFDLSMGNQLAPSLTIGWGNMISRKGNGHWSVPFEIGAEYIGKKPRIALNLSGIACQGNTSPANCQAIASDKETQQNLLAEQATINSDIPRQLRFFPIVSIGVSYRFSLAHAH